MKSKLFEKSIDFFSSFEGPRPKKAAIAYVFASSFLFAIMNILVKLSHEIPTYQIIYSRGIINIILCNIVLFNTNDSLITKDDNTNRLLIKRGIMGGMALGFYFHALQLLPISTANILLRMNPLWVGILGALFYKEKFGLLNILVMISSFTGIIMIVKPDFIWNDSTINTGSQDSNLGVLMCLINGILSALIMLTIRQLKVKFFFYF
jgi:drug/metabolite transporter (DMT)-like permease